MGEVYEKENGSAAVNPYPFKAYAKAAGEEKAKILYGGSKEEILKRLRGWNAVRPADNRFETCSIGKQQENGKYENYHKFEVASGKDISNIYLTLPKLEKEEFLKLTEELKSKGAKFNTHQKQWYVPYDADLQQFAKYLPNMYIPEELPNFNPADLKAVNIEIAVTVGEEEKKINLDPKDIGINLYFKDMEGKTLNALEVVDRIEQVVLKKMEQDMSVLQDPQESTTVLQKEALPDNSEILQPVGSLRDEILQRALKDKLPEEKLDVLMQPGFSEAQMEEMRLGFKDGLSIEQVKAYADPSISSGNMDLYRYGMQHGVSREEIAEITKTAPWSEARKEMDKAIDDHRKEMAKSFKKQGFTISYDMTRKVELLNHLTQKNNSIKDIAEAFKNGTYADNSGIQQTVTELGQYFQAQEAAVMAAAPAMG